VGIVCFVSPPGYVVQPLDSIFFSQILIVDSSGLRLDETSRFVSLRLIGVLEGFSLPQFYLYPTVSCIYVREGSLNHCCLSTQRPPSFLWLPDHDLCFPFGFLSWTPIDPFPMASRTPFPLGGGNPVLRFELLRVADPLPHRLLGVGFACYVGVFWLKLHAGYCPLALVNRVPPLNL